MHFVPFDSSIFAEYPSSFADHRAITKNLHTVSSERNVDILRSQAYQDAPTLLGYIPSYKGKLKRREKKEGGPSEKVGPSEKGGNKKKSQELRVKLLSFRKLAAFWLGEDQETTLPGFNIPLQTIVPDFAKEMLRRNTVCVNLRGNTPAPPSGSEPVMLRRKDRRRRVTSSQPGLRPLALLRKRSPRRRLLLTRGQPLRPLRLQKSLPPQEFAPSFAVVDGRLVMTLDNVKTDHGFAITMLATEGYGEDSKGSVT